LGGIARASIKGLEGLDTAPTSNEMAGKLLGNVVKGPSILELVSDGFPIRSGALADGRLVSMFLPR
jgi:hypothetical protein